MGNKPQPVPPIYQPEVAADAIHWAAHNRRTTLYGGYPTLQTVLGNRVSPGDYAAHGRFDARGLLAALEQSHVDVDLVAGTSAGAIVAPRIREALEEFGATR